MELENRDFFTDPIIKISNKDLKPLSNSYFGQHKGLHSGWYKQSVLDQIEQIPTLFDILKDNGFVKDNEIVWPSYKINKLGFRSEDWLSGNKGAIFLGCSDVFGVGNYLESTAAQIISDHLKVANYNLSIPGGGLDQAYRVLKYHIKNINADYVFLLIPEVSRREFFTDSNSVLINPQSFSVTSITKDQLDGYFPEDKLEDVYFKLFCESKNILLQTNKNIDAIRYVCEKNNKILITLKNPIYYQDRESLEIKRNATKGIFGKRKDLACDLHHPGKNFQKEIAKKLLKKL